MSITILDVISKGLAEQLELLTPPDRPVEFRLIRAGMHDPTSSRKVSTPQFHGLPGEDSIRDPFDNKARTKQIQNIVSYNAVKGRNGEATYMDPVTDFVRFGSSGSIICQPDDFNLYLFLKLHNKNRDNPNRIVKKAPVFYEVDEKKEIKSKNDNFIYVNLASNLIVDASPDDLIKIAVKVQRAFPSKHSFDVTVDPEKLMASLVFIAKNHPVDLIVAVKEPRSLARVVADDAVKRKLIFFDEHEAKLQWTWKRTAGQKGRKCIVKLEPGNNPIKGLVDFLTTVDGSEDIQELKTLFEEYYPKQPLGS